MMSPAFRSLLKKEWSERRRLLLWGLGVLLLYTGYCVAYEAEYKTRAFVASFTGTCMIFGWFGATLLAMSTANGELTQKTLRFSASLPISLKQVAWARLFATWACLAAPILCGAILITPLLATGIFEQAEFRPAFDRNSTSLLLRPALTHGEAVLSLWSLTALNLVRVIHAVTLISLIGTWVRSEEVVGFIGAIITLASMSTMTVGAYFEEQQLYFVADWIGAILPGSLTIGWGYGEWDGSHYADLELAPLLAGPMAVNFLITLALGFWFARRYGGRLNTQEATGATAGRRWVSRLLVVASRLGIRWPGRVGSLVWLNSRQSISVCLAGLVMAGLITLVSVLESYRNTSPLDWFMGSLPDATWYVGMLWGVIVAAALFSSELKTGLEQFWRSRPVSPSAWFWTKYFVGLATLLITLDVVPASISALAAYRPGTVHLGVAYWACIPLLHALMYSLTVAVLCRWRRAVPAAIAALLLFVLLDHILESIPVSPSLATLSVFSEMQRLERESQSVSLSQAGYPLVYGIVIAMNMASIAFARRAVVPPVVAIACGSLLAAAIVLADSPVVAAEPPSLGELVDRIQKRDELLQRLRLRVTSEVHRLPASYELNQEASPRRWAAARSKVPEFETKTYDLYFDGSRRAWTEFDDKGEVVSRHAFDGALLRDYQPASRGTFYEGSLSTQQSPPLLPVTTPDQILTSQVGFSLENRMAVPDSVDVTQREVDGEQWIDITATQAVDPSNDDPTSGFENRYHVTLDAGRNDWPVRYSRETVDRKTGQPTYRQVFTMNGWIEAGPLSYPREILIENFFRFPTSGPRSPELAPLNTQRITTDEIEIDPQIPESVFTDPFPVGARYYDSRDRKLHEIDAAGKEQIYQPRPKGVRGAVLAYHLLWITVALVYFIFDSRRVRGLQR